MIEFIRNNCAPNCIALMIILALVVIMKVNKNEKIPASQLFWLVTGLILFLTVADTMEMWFASKKGTPQELVMYTRLRTYCSAIIYIVRPIIIMTEVFIVIPNKKYRGLCALPAVVNAVYFSTVFFGNRVPFYIDKNNLWHSNGGNIPVFVTQFLYLGLLAAFSFYYFRHKSFKQGAVIFAICAQSLLIAELEHSYIIVGCVNAVTALCILEYYIFLSMIYQQEIKQKLYEKELESAQSYLMTLRNQIQPHFIYNSLSIIRSLARRDSKLAVECLDSFSDYLKAHIGAIRSPDMIPFAEEIKNVRIYLSLVQIDYENRVEVKYELEKTDFLIPPLSLEPIVENAVEHGIGSGGGIITIKSYEKDGNIYVFITDNGTSDGTQSAEGHNGIGLENTRKRLELQCGGSLDLRLTTEGAQAKITIPMKDGNDNEDTYSR